MTLKHLEEYRDSAIAEKLIDRITSTIKHDVRLMEVCGTHTVSIFRSGIRSLLPETISLLSGPGCPVCVTAQKEIDAFIALAREPETIVATFGDLIRVPGSGSSLQGEKADGADVRIVYSTFDAVDLAREHPDKRVVFLGVGFETTAPTVAAAILAAHQQRLDRRPVADPQSRHAQGSVEFVPAQSEKIDTQLFDPDGDLAHRLHRVAQHRDAALAAQGGHLGHRLERPQLVVGKHQTDEPGIGSERRGDRRAFCRYSGIDLTESRYKKADARYKIQDTS